MHPNKFIWAGRALLYKFFFEHVGNFSYIGKPCFIEGKNHISIGNRTRIFPGIRLEAICEGKIQIGDNCAIQQNVHITSKGVLYIGNDVNIAANTCITNIKHEYRNISKSVMEQEYLYADTVIGDGCFLGYGVVILKGTVLGKHCVVGANSVVRGHFPDYCVIAGAPAKIVKRYNSNTSEWEKVEYI